MAVLTGYANFEPSMGGKWLHMLKKIAPHLTRVGVLRIPKTAKPKLICCQQFRHANLFQSLAGPRGKPVLPLLVLEPLASSGQPLRAEADNREIQQLSGTSLVGLHGTTGAFLRHPQ